MNRTNTGPDELSFRYESDASASFLVVTSINKASEYQCGMLGRNAVKGLITPELVVKDGMTCFYYNITSRVPLSIYIKRKKLSKPEFLKLVLDISSYINDSYGYLLNASNFILSQDIVHICPDTLEPCLVYIPTENGTEDCEAFKSFVSELLLQHIHVEGFDSENIVQRILSAIKSDLFNLKSFVVLISELLYGGKSSGSETSGMLSTAASESAACLAWGEAAPAREKAAYVKEKAAYAREKAASVKEKAAASGSDNNRGKTDIKLRAEVNVVSTGHRVPYFTITAVLLQFIMAFLIYLCRGLIDSAGANKTANYAAVLLIVLAIDALLFKKILASRMVKSSALNKDNTENAGETKKVISAASKQYETEPEHPMPEVSKPRAKMTEAQKPDAAKPDVVRHEAGGLKTPEPEAARHGALRFSNKTELLGRHAKGMRILKSTGKWSEEGDIVVDKDDFIIGRLEGHVDHVLNNNAVGKLHAELINRDGTSYVRDLNSMNGTFINDNRIDSNKEYELSSNDRLRLANSEYIFTLDF